MPVGGQKKGYAKNHHKLKGFFIGKIVNDLKEEDSQWDKNKHGREIVPVVINKLQRKKRGFY
jgi:hypothetical protein